MCLRLFIGVGFFRYLRVVCFLFLVFFRCLSFEGFLRRGVMWCGVLFTAQHSKT